eukprot:CAMPEP_0172021322 /NCGR_PEP_ID=MMETSP1041-20130122/13648_1 /TAXON_ID=464988 /ORGANISM="Hemiselmis andersenii, Strain CCMP439" /LENGTH=225 /DNA_ID=CAMNT_0012676635 /DNA_START=473 /DNA_END=1149 /DNA_ORIENTATION=+
MATGYFLFDSLSVLLHMGSHGGQYLLHGVLCLITYGLAALFDVYHYWGPTFLLFEITTLFINARWWFAQLDNKEGTAYTINGISLILTWLSVRVIFGLSQSWVFWQDAFSPASAKVPAAIFAWYAFSNISLNLLNIFWFFKIMKSALGFFGVGKGKGKGKGKDFEKGGRRLRLTMSWLPQHMLGQCRREDAAELGGGNFEAGGVGRMGSRGPLQMGGHSVCDSPW